MSRSQLPGMSWRELFEQADDHEASLEAVSAVLEERRDE